MTISDNFGDLLIRIKNAYLVGHKQTVAPYSKAKEEVLKVLLGKGKIEAYKIEAQGEAKKNFLIKLLPNKEINFEVKRISKPGRRIYIKYKSLYPVKGNKGFLILSTPKGIMDGKKAKEQKLGGELLAEVF